MIQRYRKRPIEITADQFDGTIGSASRILEWIDDHDGVASGRWKDIVIRTLEGAMTVSPGDYVIKGIRGEFYPCKPDVFESTYEPVS